MSLLKRNSPRKTRERREKELGVGEKKSPTLNPVVKKIPGPDPDQQQLMLDKYAYQSPEPLQLNRSEPEPEPEPVQAPTRKAKITSFSLFDLSYFCEERIQQVLFSPHNLQSQKIRMLALDFIQSRLEVYSEYSQEVSIGSFEDTVHYYKGEILIPEEFINISGFMRKFLKIEQVHVLYETGEILLQPTGYCNFWLERAGKFFEATGAPLDRPKILDEEICLDCDFSCIFRYQQQMKK